MILDNGDFMCDGPGCGTIYERKPQHYTFTRSQEDARSKGWIFKHNKKGFEIYCSKQCEEMPF